MKRVTVTVLGDRCIGSGNCSSVAPEIFDHDHLGVALVRPGRELVDETEALVEAVEQCPVAALILSAADGP